MPVHPIVPPSFLSVATSLAILPLMIYCGLALFDFSVSILFGILIGTVSSIYVAAALLLYPPPIGGRMAEIPA